MNVDLTVLEKYPQALAKVVAAIAEAYYDNVLSPKADTRAISEQYTKAFNFCPNYRLILKSHPGYEKYKHLQEDIAQINSLPLVQPVSTG